MSESGHQQIRVSADTWKRLNQNREPGETFDDVVRRLAEFEENGSNSRAGS